MTSRTGFWRAVGLALLAAGCGSKGEPTSDTVRSAASNKPVPAPTTSVSATPAPPPRGPVDLDKKTWTQDGAARPLVMTDLGPSCFLKGAQILLPDKAATNPASGSRGCVVRAWGQDGPYMAVVSDELPFKPTPKEELKGIKRFFDETPESWLAEETDAAVGYTGRLTRKLGSRTYWCMVNANGKPNGAETVRGMMALCTTLSEPSKP